MSLWEKWEREKLKEQGIDVPYDGDVEIHEMREKPNWKKQLLILFAAVVGCFLVTFAAITFLRGANWWSDTYFARLLRDRNAQRQSMSANPE
jgi:hypothetical protein